MNSPRKSRPRLTRRSSMPVSPVAAKPNKQTVLDTMGHEHAGEVLIDTLKSRFFALGLQAGIALNCFVVSVAVMVVSYDPRSGAIYVLSGSYYPLYRALLLISVFGCCHGLNLFVFKRFGVDYRAIYGVGFEHNYHVVLRGCFTLMSLVFLSFMLFVFTLTSGLTPNRHLWPAVALLGAAALFAWPWDIYAEWHDARQRHALLRAVCRVLVAPFSEASFAHCFLADVFTSMPKIFVDVLQTGCLYASGGIFAANWDKASQRFESGTAACTNANLSYKVPLIVLSVLPFWLRLMQCCRAYRDTSAKKNIVNGCKYCSSIAVVLLSFVKDPEHPGSAVDFIWAATAIFSTAFTMTWDVVMDWGHGPAWLRGFAHGAEFGRPSSAPLLRTSRAYPLWSYYVALVYNGCARLGWAVYISPGQTVVQQHVVLLLGCVELLRRAQWATFRLEWEQIHRHLHDEPTEEESIWPSPRGAERPVTLEQALSRNRDMMQTRYTLMEPNEPEESER